MTVQIIVRVQYFTVAIPPSSCITSIYIHIYLCCYTEGEHAPMDACNDKILNCREKKPCVLKICPSVPWVQVTHKMASGMANCRTKASYDKGNTIQHEADNNNNHSSVWIDYSGWTKCLNANSMLSVLLVAQNGKIRPLKCQLLRMQ